MDTCTDCHFTALFMYTSHGRPLCPKCNVHEIEAYKALITDIDDSLEASCEYLNDDVFELDFK